jgi:GINS complex subunit 3
MVSVDLPRTFGGKVREQLLADPTTVRLRDRSPSFYEVGITLSRLVVDLEAATLPTSTRVALATRMPLILDFSLNSLHQDVSLYLNTLTNMERQLFFGGYNFAKDRHAWKQRKGFSIRPSSLVTAHESKRKRART